MDLLVRALDDDVRQGLLILQLMAHLWVATRALTDTDARAYLRTTTRGTVLAVHLRLRLLVHGGRPAGLRVIIIVDVDVVVVYYLNDLSRGACSERPELQLAQAEGVELLLELITMLALDSLDRAPSMLWRIPHEHLRVPLAGGILRSHLQVRLLVRDLPLLGRPALALQLDGRVRCVRMSRNLFVIMIILVTYLNTYVLRLHKVLVLSYCFPAPPPVVVVARHVLHRLLHSIHVQSGILCGSFVATTACNAATLCIWSRGH